MASWARYWFYLCVNSIHKRDIVSIETFRALYQFIVKYSTNTLRKIWLLLARGNTTWNGIVSIWWCYSYCWCIANALHWPQTNVITETQHMPPHNFCKLLNCMYLVLWHLKHNKKFVFCSTFADHRKNCLWGLASLFSVQQLLIKLTLHSLLSEKLFFI